MVDSILLQEMTRQEASAIAPEALVILPVGATEQHGPHLPTGTDFFIVEYIARTAAAEIAGQYTPVVTPTLPFGSSHHHLPFGATMSISTTTCYALYTDLIESLIQGGFRQFFILNGHGGNDDIIRLVARDVALKHPVKIGAASYWTIAWDSLIAEEAHLAGALPGHAGVFETSIMLALHAALVPGTRPERKTVETADPRSYYPAYKTEQHGFWQSFDGFTDSPASAEAGRGERYLRSIVSDVVNALVRFIETGTTFT